MISPCDFFAGLELCDFQAAAESVLQKLKLADVMFFMAWTGKDHPQMLNISEQISVTVPTWDSEQEQ